MLFLFQAEMAGEALMPNMAHFVEIWRAALQNGQADPETAFYTTVTLTHLVSAYHNRSECRKRATDI